jgi:hypothetical protein
MGSLKKIKELLKFTKKKTYKINMYAEAVLDDARVIATDSESFEVGAEIYIINDSGEVESLPEGIYTLEDGTKIRVDENSLVAGFGEEEVVEEEVVEEGLQEDESSAEKADWAESYEKLKDRVEELEKAVYGEEKELSKETEKEEEPTIELTGDAVEEVLTKLESIETKLSALEDTPSSNGLKISPAHKKMEKVDMRKLDTQERVLHLMNNYSK